MGEIVTTPGGNVNRKGVVWLRPVCSVIAASPLFLVSCKQSPLILFHTYRQPLFLRISFHSSSSQRLYSKAASFESKAFGSNWDWVKVFTSNLLDCQIYTLLQWRGITLYNLAAKNLKKLSVVTSKLSSNSLWACKLLKFLPSLLEYLRYQNWELSPFHVRTYLHVSEK